VKHAFRACWPCGGHHNVTTVGAGQDYTADIKQQLGYEAGATSNTYCFKTDRTRMSSGCVEQPDVVDFLGSPAVALCMPTDGQALLMPANTT
jgi:hypothetical protein